MEKVMINQLGDYVNKEIVSFFLATQKELREGTKDLYVRMRLSDKSGSINANIWNNAKALSEKFQEGDVVKIKGIVINYKGQVQLTISKIKKADDYEIDYSDYVMTTSKDMNQLTNQLFSYIDSVKDEFLREMLHNIFDDKEFFYRFVNAPAAKSWHHNYAGGLLEHSVSVAAICDFSAKMYPVNRDLLLTGAILHDVGKVYEYNFKTMIEFTTVGRLIGHICLGDELVCQYARAINAFPENTLLKLRHLILSHHGEYEKAAARLPQTIEAIVLHFADNLDAQTVGAKQLIEGQTLDSDWSEYDKLNERYYYIG